MANIKVDKLLSTLYSIMYDNGFTKTDANICAEIFAENTLVGVSSHGINRFPKFYRV